MMIIMTIPILKELGDFIVMILFKQTIIIAIMWIIIIMAILIMDLHIPRITTGLIIIAGVGDFLLV